MLTAATGAAAGIALPAYLRPRSPLRARAVAARPHPFKSPLPLPPVLDAATIEIPIVEREVPILPGAKTRMWTYGGTYPGPTIRRPSGTTTRVTYEHRLPPAVGELTTHLHGGHNTSADDGQPGGLTASQPRSLYCDISPQLSAAESGNDLLIGPGGSRTYTYDLVEDGAPERAAARWYHDHRLDRTGRNVWRGLAGLWITDDEVDAALPLPRGNRELPLVIADHGFNRHNQLTSPFGGHAPSDGATGRYVLINGAHLPHRHVSACRYRLRILNASNFRVYNLRLTRGAEMTLIGTGGGLLPRPLRRKRILIGPGERVDLIVDFSGVSHREVELISVRRRRDAPTARGSRAYEGPLMQFRVGKRAPDRSSIPARLRPLPDWVEEAEAEPSPSHTWRITVGGGLSPPWLINGRTFDPGYADVRPRVGTVQTWRLVNRTSVAHLMHLHHTSWYMLSRNGARPGPRERCLKDTFLLDPHEEIVIAGRLSDHLGKYVIHCHMLEHEDHGLMSQFEIVA